MTSVLTNPVTLSLPAAWNTTASQDTVPASCPPTMGPVLTALLCRSSHTGDTGGGEQQGPGFTAFFLSLHPHLLCAYPVPWLEIASMCWLSDLYFWALTQCCKFVYSAVYCLLVDWIQSNTLPTSSWFSPFRLHTFPPWRHYLSMAPPTFQ